MNDRRLELARSVGPEKSLKGKVTAITGASSGIGRALSLAMGADGARLIVAARHIQPLEEVCRIVRDTGGEAYPISTDLSHDRGAEAVVNTAIEQFGTIDILINNAGISTYGPYEESGYDEIRRVISVNLEAPMQASRIAIPIFKSKGSGIIVNVSSIGAFAGAPWIASYCATKAALKAFTDSLRIELAPYGINVIGVYPGVVRTSFVENNRSLFTPSARTAPNLYSFGGEVESEELAEHLTRAIKVGKSTDIYSHPLTHLAAFFSTHVHFIVERSLQRRYTNLLRTIHSNEPRLGEQR